jgi:hypothetical protein
MLFLEIQKGKKLMDKEAHVREMNMQIKTAATVVRMAEATSSTSIVDDDVPEDTFLGDSWFAGIEAAAQTKKRGLGHFIGIIKTNHGGFPKKYLEETMKDWPPGSHLVLEGTYLDVPLLAVGYKYNKRKVCGFVATKGAGHTEPGVCYEAKWKDDNMNTRSRDVPRPEIIAKYFLRSNGIDVHNQTRQSDLALEKHWITTDGFFRLVTTLFGMTVTDASRAYQFHLPHNHRHKSIDIIAFTRLLCKDLLNNTFSKTAESDNALVILSNAASAVSRTDPYRRESSSTSLSTTNAHTSSNESQDLSSLTTSPVVQVPDAHVLASCDYQVTHSIKERTGKRRKRGECIECKRKTKYYCTTCPPSHGRAFSWCCPDMANGPAKRQCHAEHKKKAQFPK